MWTNRSWRIGKYLFIHSCRNVTILNLTTECFTVQSGWGFSDSEQWSFKRSFTVGHKYSDVPNELALREAVFSFGQGQSDQRKQNTKICWILNTFYLFMIWRLKLILSFSKQYLLIVHDNNGKQKQVILVFDHLNLFSPDMGRIRHLKLNAVCIFIVSMMDSKSRFALDQRTELPYFSLLE